MNIPNHFEISDNNEIMSFIQTNGFGQLISTLDGKHFATHIHFLLNAEKDKLLAHIAKKNPQHNQLDGQDVLVTLQGPHGYISPSWYSSPGVPTWNYQAVHIYGMCKIVTNEEILASIVNSLTVKYESKFDEPWKPNYKATMLGAIIGLEISIVEIQCKYKLSQNRSISDRQQVISQLEKKENYDLAEAMKSNEQ